MESKFVFLVKEMYFFLTESLPRENSRGINLGDWKFTQQRLKDNDLQLVIYRKSTEINFLFSYFGENRIEMYVKADFDNDTYLFDAIKNYFKLSKEKRRVNQTFYFRDTKELNTFIYQYLLVL